MKIYQKGWFVFLVILALIAINQFAFASFFKISYFDWYLKNGSIIGAITVLVTFAFDNFDKDAGFISANPRVYCGAYMQLVGVQILSLGMPTSKNLKESEDGTFKIVDILDSLAELVFSLLLIVVFILWLVIVVPIQYFPVLLLGGIGRVHSRTRTKFLAKLTNTKSIETGNISHEEKKPDDWMEVGIGSKPVKFTFILITAALAVLNFYR